MNWLRLWWTSFTAWLIYVRARLRIAAWNVGQRAIHGISTLVQRDTWRGVRFRRLYCLRRLIGLVGAGFISLMRRMRRFFTIWTS